LLRLERRPVKVDPTEKYQEVGIYCFGRGMFHKAPRTGLEVGEKELFLLRQGDFILQVTFAWEGAVAIASAAEDGMYGSTRYPTFRVNEMKCDPQFLLHYFKTEEGLRQLVKICPGSAGRNRVLSIRRIPEVWVPLPSLVEQRRLVTVIEEVSARVCEMQCLRRQAEKDAKALWARSAARVLEPFEQSSNVSVLSDVVSVRGGGTPSKGNPLYWAGSIPWVTPKDMKLREIRDGRNHISQQATFESAAKLIESGAVLVVVRGMILSHTFPSAVLRVPATINQDMKALVPKSELLPEYLCALFWAWNDRFVSLVEKSTHDTRKLETHVLMRMRIPVPPVAEQCKIITHLDHLRRATDALSALHSATSEELHALMPSVLHNIFHEQEVSLKRYTP
jgi:type I restriction enzyme S subunit